MKVVKIDKKEYQLKSCFSEFNQKDLLMCCRVLSAIIPSDKKEIPVIEYNQLRMVLFHELLDISSKNTLQITAEQWVDILPHLNYCFDTPKFVGNLLPIIKNKLTFFYGPIGLLDNSSFGEMISADHAFQNAVYGDKDSFYLLASILYRPKRIDLSLFKESEKWNGDVREPFNLERSKERMYLFKRLPFEFIIAIFIYYKSFRVHRLEGFEDLFKGSAKKSKRDIGWFAVALELAATKFGNYDETFQQNCFNVLIQIEREIEKENNKKVPQKK